MPKKPAIAIRKKPSTQKADAFVEGKNSGSQEVKTLGRPKGKEKEQVTLYLEPEIAQKLRVHAAMVRSKMSDIAQKAIAEFLSKGPTKSL